MAGTRLEFKIYHEQYYGGMFESISQNVAVFNANSMGAITLTVRDILGQFSKESFIKDLDMIFRRNGESVAAITDAPMIHGEFVTVKLDRRIGPVAQTIDAWRKINQDPQVMSYVLGQMAGERKVKDFVNTSLRGAVAAISGVPAVNPVITGTVSHTALVRLISAFGDMSSNLVAFAMHSGAYFDLMEQAIADKVYEVAGTVIYSGNVVTLNRPTIVTDSPALLVPGSPGKYKVLALAAGGISIEESDAETVAFELVTGLENLVYRYQGEYAFNLGIKGFAWDTEAGGANPTDAALATALNWKKQATSEKNIAGAMITVDAKE